MSDSRENKMESMIVQACHYVDETTGGISPPLQFSTTYARDEDYEPRVPGLSYGRDKNPTYLIAERVVAEADLERAAQSLIDEANARGGEDNITVALIRCDEA